MGSTSPGRVGVKRGIYRQPRARLAVAATTLLVLAIAPALLVVSALVRLF